MPRGRALDEEVTAALADVQARQQRLALGSVLPRTSSPPSSPHAASSPHQPPVSKDKALQATAQFQWLKRRIVRRSEHQEREALEDLGSLDVVSSASLATVRTLIGQFIPLPARREFVFVHPTTNTLVDAEQEKNVFARDLPFICIELLPGKAKAEPAVYVVAHKAAEQRRPRPETAHSQPEQQQIERKGRPKTVDTRQVVTAAESSVLIPVAGAAVTKKEQISPVRTKRERPDVLLPVQEEKKQTSDDTKGTASLYVPTMLSVKKMVPELQLVPEHKRATSASLAAGPRARILVSTTEKDKKEGRGTSIRGISSAGGVISRENHKQEDEELAMPGSMTSTETVSTSEVHALVQHDCLLEFGDEDAVANEGTVADDDIVADEGSVAGDPIPTPDALNSLHGERPLNRKPGQLRRSRRFKELIAATLAEKSWGVGELEQQELLSDENIEEFIRVVLEIIRTGLDGAETHQIDEALLYYGIDCRELELHQLLLALDSELSTRCNHVQSGVDGQLKQFLLKIFPVDGDNTIDSEGLQQFEYALNLFVGMRGWQFPTKLRANCFEERHPLQLIPASDSRRLAILRLTDKDRQLFALASSDNSTSRFESWLADGMEITYVLLYGFLLSRRNSGPKALAKLDILHIRQERIQAAIQKLSSFSFDVWKRLEFRTSDLEETFMMRRLNKLLKPFLRDNTYNGELAGSVFYPALVGYLTKKCGQLSQSLCTQLVSPTGGVNGPLHATVLEYLRLLRQHLEHTESHSRTSYSYLQSVGLEIMDIEKINVSRSSAGLGRIYVNGTEAILTHHQCKLAARDRDLQLKARWDQPKLSRGEVSRYCFLGGNEIVLEYVFVRMNAGTSNGEDMCWEDRQAIAKVEARQAFAFLCSDPLVVPPNVAIGIGANVVHTDLLPHLPSMLSLSTVLREYAGATSVSFGYCYDPTGQNIRVVFRVHTLSSVGGHGYAKGAAACWGLKSAFRGLDRFLASTQEEGAISFCEAEGLRFLNSYLHDREYEWFSVKYGKPCFAHMYSTKGAGMVCPRADILRTIKRAITIIPNAPHCITKTNINIVVQLIDLFQEAPDVADEAIDVLMAICSNDSPPQSLSEYVARPMTDSQGHFMRQTGLKILVDTRAKLEEIPLYKAAFEMMILSLLMTQELSATKTGLLVHHKAWFDYYVETRAWTSEAPGPQFLVYLLGQIHSHFFTITSFVEPVSKTCPCGCSGYLLEIIDASIGVMRIFGELMTTEVGLIWAQDAMQGPRDCLLFMLWCAQQNWGGSAMDKFQELIFVNLCEFLNLLTSSHQYLCLLSELTPSLLALLHQEQCVSLHTGALRVLSLMFRLAVDKKVWLISMEGFLAAFYQILENICGDSTYSSVNHFMVDTLFHLESDMRNEISSNILLLLHEEHITFTGCSGQLSPVARSCTKSLLQTLVSFCSLTGTSILQPACQIPALICLEWLLTSLEIAADLAKLDLDDVLLTLMENESAVVSILASQAYISHLFHGLTSCRLIAEHQLKKFCNQVITVLATGSRLTLSPKRFSGAVKQEDIQFATNTHALYAMLHRYKSLNSATQSPRQQGGLDQDGTPKRNQSLTDIIWRSSEWNDANRAASEKIAVYLNLLVVFSSMTSNVISIGGSDEIRDVILHLVRYVRERVHTASYYTTLYLLSLRNIIWATRLAISKWGITELVDPSFLRKLLLLTKDKLYQDLASGVLWGLAEAYEKSNIFLLSFEVEDADSYNTKKNGFAAMVENLASKIAGNRSIENNAGALASMIANPLSSSFFLGNYGYPFVLKLMESVLRLLRAGHIIEPSDRKVREPVGKTFGTRLFYQYPISNQHERELFQLCRAAVNALEATLLTSPESVLDEAARTKATMLPLIDYPNKQVAVHAVVCCSIHLQAHPLKCGKLIDDDFLDKVLAFSFYEEFPPIQIAAFSCMKLVFADQKNLLVLQPKIFQLREKIVSCLHSSVFEVKRKVILFLVEAVFRLDDQVFLDGIANAFSATDNSGLLMEIFASISKEIAQNPAAGGVLQLLIRLITKLDLVAHTGGDQLVHVICHTLKTHSTNTFLRPLLFNFMHQVVTQDGHVEYLERKSRLDVITALLSYDLTMNELRDVGNMLLLILSKHEGIRQYLSGFDSGCIPKLAGVLDTFSEYMQSMESSKGFEVTPENANLSKNGRFEADAGAPNSAAVLDKDAMKYLLKITTSKAIYISNYTEDVYVLFLQLLYIVISEQEFCTEERYGCQCETGCSNCDPCDIIAKAIFAQARCGHGILRLATAHRIVCPSCYDLQVILSTKTESADLILQLTPKVLRILSANYQTRMQMLRGSTRLDWMWISALAKVATQSSVSEDEQVGISDVPAADAILCMGHLSSAKDVAQRLTSEKALVSMLFAYITPMSPLFASNVEIRRASSFTLARLAEYPVIVCDHVFQEKMAILSHVPMANDQLSLSSGEQDTIVLANRMILSRNGALLTPGMQGRSVGEGTLSLLAHLLLSEEVGDLAADVLASLLCFKVNMNEEKRFNSALWRYSRALSPGKSTKDLHHPSSKRLTAYLHNWMGPMVQKLRHSSFGTFDDHLVQVLNDELDYMCKHFKGGCVASLLLRLISLHLPLASEAMDDTGSPDYNELDEIVAYKHNISLTARLRGLQYVFTAPSRVIREQDDRSFRGSAHLWLFLQKLWELANDNPENQGQTILEVTEIIAARLPPIFASWGAERAVRCSAMTFARRKCFLDFVISVGKVKPNVLNVIDCKHLLEAVFRNGPDTAATMGREYLLLVDMCKLNPDNLDMIIAQFGCADDNKGGQPTEIFRRFWQPVQLHLLPVTFTSTSKVKTTILDPCPEADLSTVFGLDLLKLLSSRDPAVLLWFAQSQGATLLLDIMFLASKKPALHMQHFLMRSFLSNVLCLLNQLLELDPTKYQRFCASDPRYVRSVVDLVYVPAHEIQTSAIKLLQTLVKQPRLFALLSRLEDVVKPIASVSADVISYAGEMLTNLQLAPPLHQDYVVLLTHLLFVPFFSDLSILELVKLSMGFRRLNQTAPDCWMILMHDCRFSSIPEWMMGKQPTASESLVSATKLFQREFDELNGHCTIYAIDKATYIGLPSVTRKRIAARLDSLLKLHIDESNLHRGSSRNSLVMRLGRMLVDDRAEIIRRVAYTKRIPERVLFDQMRNRQLSDLLLLLHESPLFEGIHKDHLANLAFRLGSPVEIVINSDSAIEDLPLILIYDECIEFEMRLPGTSDFLRGSVSRGGLLGFPPWLTNNAETATVVHKCGLLGAILSLEALESELPEPSWSLVNDRLHRAYEADNPHDLFHLMGRDPLPEFESRKRRLQSSALSLMVQLTTAEVFIESLLNDCWAIGVIVDVALGAFAANIVLDALRVVAVMTASESYTKEFCGKVATVWNDPLSYSLDPVVAFVNRFKLRLWQGHPDILAEFFLIQSNFSRYLPEFWTNLEDVWTTKYLRSCLALLRSNECISAGVVACHLSDAILHRKDFLINYCGRVLSFNLEVAHVLVHTQLSGNIVGILRLFTTLSSEDVLCEQMWEQVIRSSDSFDSVLKLVATKISDTEPIDLRDYCEFLHVICASGINEQLESEFRQAAQDRFGILSVLLQRLQHLPQEHAIHVVLRCIGGMCVDVPSNCYTAVTISSTEIRERDFITIVIKTLTEVENHLKLQSAVDPLVIEAAFSCIDAIVSVPEQWKSIEIVTAVTIGMQVIQLLSPQILDTNMVRALQSVVKVLLHATTQNDELLLNGLTGNWVAIVVASYECISTHYSKRNDCIHVLRLLERFTALFDALVSSRHFRNMLWTVLVSDSDSTSLVTWIYHWVTFDPSKSLAISALYPSRVPKRDLLVAVSSKIQSEILSSAIKLSEHASINRVLSLHSNLPVVINYIFSTLPSESCSQDVERAGQWMKFLCFLSEQWSDLRPIDLCRSDQKDDNAVHSILQQIHVPTLLKACSIPQVLETSFICYAFRLLWVLVTLHRTGVASISSDVEWLELIPLATRILRGSSTSRLTLCYLTGLLAEWALNQETLTSHTLELVDLVHLLLVSLQEVSFPKEKVGTVAASITNDYLCAQNWVISAENLIGDQLLDFSLIHQSQRLVVYLFKTPEIRLALSTATFFHPLMCGKLFRDAIVVLCVKREEEPWIEVQRNALALIKESFVDFPEVDCSPSLASYRLVARREKMLQFSMDLLTGAWTQDLKYGIVEALIAYLRQNISAGCEIAILRERNKGDLIEILAASIIRQESPDFMMLCVRLFNAIIEYSVVNARYVASSQFLEFFRKLREVASVLDLSTSNDPLRTFYWAVRMLSGSHSNLGSDLVQEAWRLISVILLRPQHPSRLEQVKIVLEILNCSGKMNLEVLARIELEWLQCGKTVVLALIKLTQGMSLSSCSGTELILSIGELSVKAMKRLCSSEVLAQKISNDPEIVAALLSDCEYFRRNSYLQLLANILGREPTTRKDSLLTRQLSGHVGTMFTLSVDRAFFLLELLPCFIGAFRVQDVESETEPWDDLLQCIVREIDPSTHQLNEDDGRLMITGRALASAATFCDFRDVSRDILFRLHGMLKQQLPSMPNSDPTSDFYSTSVQQPALGDFLLLAFIQICDYMEEELPLVEPRYFSLWMNSSVCRLVNVIEENQQLLLCSLAAKAQPTPVLRLHWRILTRMFASFFDEVVHANVSKLLLSLLQGPTNCDFRNYVADTLKLDLIDVLWWEVSTSMQTEESNQRELWYSLLYELCYSRENAIEIMNKGFLEGFIRLEGNLLSEQQPQHASLELFLRLLSCVLRSTDAFDHAQLFRNEPSCMEILSEICISTVTFTAKMNEAKWNATEILHSLAANQQTLTILWKSYYLDPPVVFPEGKERLRAVSELLLQCQNDLQDLVIVLELVLNIFVPDQSVSLLVRARNVPQCCPMVDVLAEVLYQCLAGSFKSSSNLRAVGLTTTSPADFLPSRLSSSLDEKATVLALQLVCLCATDPDFAYAVEPNLDLLCSLVTCLATSHWDVASTAAGALTALIQSTSDYCNDGGGVERYMCNYGAYRRLDFFVNIDDQDLFPMSPPSHFPSWFVLFVRWIRFYSVNLHLLGSNDTVERFTTDVKEDLVDLIDATDAGQRSQHELIAGSILELLLYIVSNFHPIIYKTDNTEAEEKEQLVFLQSLLSLCQRRPRSASGLNCEDNCVVWADQIRSRSLELVQLLCSLDLPHTSSVDVFTTSKQMEILMLIVERSTSDSEQKAAVELMQALALNEEVKALLIKDTSLLFRFEMWLDSPQLQLLAASILQRLATPSSSVVRPRIDTVFDFSPSAQLQLAQFLFVGVRRNQVDHEKNPTCLQKVRTMRVAIVRETFSSSVIVVQMKIEIVDGKGSCLRSFEHVETLRRGNELSVLEFLLEATVEAVRCTVYVSGGEKVSVTNFNVSRGFGSSVHSNSSVTLRLSEISNAPSSSSSTGILSCLLRQEGQRLSPEFFRALYGLISEFCKDYRIYGDPVVDLKSQILAVLALSTEFSTVGRMDVSCLECLARWLPSKPTLSSLRLHVTPVLKLLQGLRQLSCVEKATKNSQLENCKSNSSPFSFLETFVELIGSIESHDVTANVLNTLFMENSDLLLYLCHQFNPERSSEATFLSLVALAIRKNAVHCQSFLTTTAQSLLISVFNAGIKKSDESEERQGNLLHFAALVAVRLARSPTPNNDVVENPSILSFFSRVSFEVFGRHLWTANCFPTQATENLVLACGFLCGGVLNCVTVDADTQEEKRFEALVSTDAVPEDGLAVIEMLLMFLGRKKNEKDVGQGPYDSFDRLASTILASLVEKAPSRMSLELTVLQILDGKSHKTDKIVAKSFEEQCLGGMRKCITLTRYDFQSELNTLRLTYYSSIRAGVRTGIIPPQCSGVFQRFDQEQLLPSESAQWHLSQFGGNEHVRRAFSYVRRHSGGHHSDSSTKHLQADEARIDSELRELVLFSQEHDELLSVLTANRKKAMSAAIRDATQNARVLSAFHSMTSIALDFFMDMQKLTKSGDVGNSDHAIFLEWLLLLEQLAGLICSGLHELQASYYVEIARQFRSLILDLPAFLRKMERHRTHSRQQALIVFLDNLHRLLKRATNRNELRVIAANGSGIVDQAKASRERLRGLDVQLSAVLSVLLDSPQGMDNLSRMLVAMQYMWRRVMGNTSLETTMASSRQSVSLFKKIKGKIVTFVLVLRKPRMLLRTRPKKLPTAQEFVDPSDIQSTPEAADSERPQTDKEHGFSTLTSSFPLTSLEFLLDHFGSESVAAKRTKLLLQCSKQKNRVIEVLRSVVGGSDENVERMSVLELAENFYETTMQDVLTQLGQTAREDEIPFTNLPFVVHDQVEMNLWRLMVRPIQRLRVFHLYQQAQRFVANDSGKRRIILESYGQASPHRLSITKWPGTDVENETESPIIQLEQKTQGTSVSTRLFALKKDQRVGIDQFLQEKVAPVAAGPWTAVKVVISSYSLQVCDGISNPDPFSDAAAMILLRRKLEAHKIRRDTTSIARFRSLTTETRRSVQYRYDKQDGILDKIRRSAVAFGARLVLLVAFWRQEELRTDLQDPTMAQAFDNPQARDEFYRLYHAKKGLGELVRVWMPSSGKLGLPLWQERRYAFGGTVLSVAISFCAPTLAFDVDSDASKRNIFMTRIVYSYGIGIFLLSVVSIALIARSRFVLLEQTRLRLRPVSRYYQNILAVTAIGVELVQLNSLAFDSAVEWDSSDDLPAVVEWLGGLGITKFGISSPTEVEALGLVVLLFLWFLLLKCANKFRETSALLHRVLTKDLPALAHGFLYMGTISIFFSYLACTDCSSASFLEKCRLNPQAPPFLIAHKDISCWTSEHRWYALVGLWGVTFFLPIGLLAHGMSQVLFQRDTLDIKYAPVLLLVTQLVKAAAATAQAFFPFNPLALASLGAVGNAGLLVLTLMMRSCSLWYIKYIKCSIYAASCWASLGAIHRLHYAEQSSTRSLNMIYVGWLSIVLAAAVAILTRVWLRARAKQRDAERQFAAQQRLLHSVMTNGLGVVEREFVKAAMKHSDNPLTRDAFVGNAKRLSASTPPLVLTEFMARVNEPANVKEAARGVLFVQSARVLAKKLHQHPELRRRR